MSEQLIVVLCKSTNLLYKNHFTYEWEKKILYNYSNVSILVFFIYWSFSKVGVLKLQKLIKKLYHSNLLLLPKMIYYFY